jgi:hypothetical protein
MRCEETGNFPGVGYEFLALAGPSPPSLIASQLSARMALIVLCSADFFGVHDSGSRAKPRNEAGSSR